MTEQQTLENTVPLHTRLAHAAIAELKDSLDKRGVQATVELVKEQESDDPNAANAPWVATIKMLVSKADYLRVYNDTDLNSNFDAIVFQYNRFSEYAVGLGKYRRDLYCQVMKAIGDGVCRGLKESGCPFARWQFPQEGSSRWNFKIIGGTEVRMFNMDRIPRA
ncbi:MAG: hypothetical protein K2X29_01005, partial [Candidatus Obscuribacterales bacterium]|nr:hypothetical protein [Candidatus Obscuribacterales bacterium]